LGFVVALRLLPPYLWWRVISDVFLQVSDVLT
jgi:hypothetical protein